jgi:hypothetical protein
MHDVLGIRRLHEFIARSAAGFIAVGMLAACWCAWKGFRKNLLHERLFWTWSLVTLLPLAGIFFSECLLVLVRFNGAWAMPIRGVLRNSVFSHLGFWEWSASAAVFVFLCAAVFLCRPRTGLEDRGECTAAFARRKCRSLLIMRNPFETYNDEVEHFLAKPRTTTNATEQQL